MQKKMLKTIISITKECQISLHSLLLLLLFFLIIMLWPQFPPLSREAVDESVKSLVIVQN